MVVCNITKKKPENKIKSANERAVYALYCLKNSPKQERLSNKESNPKYTSFWVKICSPNTKNTKGNSIEKNPDKYLLRTISLCLPKIFIIIS